MHGDISIYALICTSAKIKEISVQSKLDKIQISIYLLQSNFEEKLALLRWKRNATIKRYNT